MAKRMTKPQHQKVAAWIFGPALLVVLVCVLWPEPDELKHQVPRFICTLAAGFFGCFVMGLVSTAGAAGLPLSARVRAADAGTSFVLALLLLQPELLPDEKTAEIQRDVEIVKEGQQAQVTQAALAASEQRLRECLRPKRVSEDPVRRVLPPDLAEQAELLRVRGDKRQQALAEIALKNHARANEIVQELKEHPGDDAFQILTLEGDNWYSAGEFDRAVRPYEQALALRPDDVQARIRAALALQRARQGDVARHRSRAVAIHQGTLDRVPDHSFEWAAIQFSLGVAWRNMPGGDRAENLRRAIAAYEEATEVYTRDACPDDWAATQHNLGNVWAEMPEGDRAENLRRAIATYEEALEVRTRHAYPEYWARTQHTIGLTWAEMPEGDRAENLRRAIAAYEEALEVYTRDAYPIDWAGIQHALGIAWKNLPEGDRAENLRRANAAYEAALEVRTRDSHPAEWARTQISLANLWQAEPVGDRAANLRRAVAAYEAVMEVCTRDAHPVEWASSQHNLAVALALLAEVPGEDRCGLLRRALACGELALTVRTREAFPREHEDTAWNLKIDRRAYESAGCGAAEAEQEPPPPR